MAVGIAIIENMSWRLYGAIGKKKHFLHDV